MEVHVCNRDGALLRAFALGDSDELIIGRESHCDIYILSRCISREHCSIERNGQGLVLRDLESKAGTYVNGGRTEAVRLTDGMEVRVGPAVLKFFESEF